jgi:hypothetical protein
LELVIDRGSTFPLPTRVAKTRCRKSIVLAPVLSERQGERLIFIGLAGILTSI